MERSECMRHYIVLKSAVIGLTAFYSMLVRSNRKSTEKLDLRGKLSQLF